MSRVGYRENLGTSVISLTVDSKKVSVATTVLVYDTMSGLGTVKHIPKETRYNFLTQHAPASYVAGAGRSASGFTTRSDIGPARSGPSEEVIAEARERRGEEPEYDPDAVRDPEDDTNLFAGTTYEADDEEADRIWESVDEKMDERRRARREAIEAEELAQERRLNPKLSTQFADLKRTLATLSDADWNSIPETSNMTGKRRKHNLRLEENQSGKMYAVSDTVLADAAGRNTVLGELDQAQQENGGYDTPADGAMTDLVSIGNARDRVLGLRLDQISKDASGTSTSVDAGGYMTALNSQQLQSDTQISDVKQARQLFKNLTESNPKHAPGWIAAANVEVYAKKMVAARRLIEKGCEHCPKNEDVWFHAAEINTPENAKVILGRAIQHVPKSVKIWMKAAQLETEVGAKKRVMRKALEYIPNSVQLWKEAINLETDQDEAKVLLARAVEIIPQSVELWLTLARVETPANAKGVINKARLAVPTSHEIWIAAARLTESTGVAEAQVKAENGVEAEKAALEAENKLRKMIDKIMATAVVKLGQNQVELSREQWMAEAERCETDGSPMSAQSIVRATIHLDVEEVDRMSRWTDDAEQAEAKGFLEIARAIHGMLVVEFDDDEDVWQAAAMFEKKHGSSEAVLDVLKRGTIKCPHAETLWLMSAKEMWQAQGDIPGARAILESAFEQNPDSESIFLAAAKLFAETGEMEAAQQILQKAQVQADTERIWMKSAALERQLGKYEDALKTLDTAISKFPQFAKFYMMRGQILQDNMSDVSGAREAYAKGVKACPKSVPLWILSARLEENAQVVIKARALLERARLLNPKKQIPNSKDFDTTDVERLWAEAIKLEERHGGPTQAKGVLARALQDCPKSPVLWAMAIFMETPQGRKSKSIDALKKAGDHALVISAVAQLFWHERKIEKARTWMERSIKADPDCGDAWAAWYRFELEKGEPERRQLVIDRCTAANPRHGELWQSISKDLKNVGKSTAEILELAAAKVKK